jgi:hypothetical protein
MATKKISQLTNAAAFSGTEQIPLVQSGVTLKGTPNQMATFMQTALNLSQYVTNSALSSTLANYVTNSSLASTLSGYVTTGTLSSTLANYVTNASLSSTLSGYVTTGTLSSTLANYVTNASLSSTLAGYVTTGSLSSQLANYVLATTLSSTLANYVSLAGTQTITGTKTFSNASTKFYTNLGISPSASGGGAPVNWVSRFGNLVQSQVLDAGINTAGAAWFQNYNSTDDSLFNVIALNPQGGDVVVNRITSAGYKFDVNGTFRNANSAYLATTAGGAVGIGLTTIDSSAQLHMSSTTKGLIVPRLTTTQINAIATPANGLLVYNTTQLAHCFYDSTGWKRYTHVAM